MLSTMFRLEPLTFANLFHSLQQGRTESVESTIVCRLTRWKRNWLREVWEPR